MSLNVLKVRAGLLPGQTGGLRAGWPLPPGRGRKATKGMSPSSKIPAESHLLLRTFGETNPALSSLSPCTSPPCPEAQCAHQRPLVSAHSMDAFPGEGFFSFHPGQK